MKFTVAALLAALTTACYAQSINIGFPANGTFVTPGRSLVVEVDRPASLTSKTEIDVVIGIQSCGSTACLAPGLALGSILFIGPYNPQYQPSAPPSKPPHQNFTVVIPLELALAPALLSVYHVSLVGASLVPLSETKAIVLNVANHHE